MSEPQDIDVPEPSSTFMAFFSNFDCDEFAAHMNASLGKVVVGFLKESLTTGALRAAYARAREALNEAHSYYEEYGPRGESRVTLRAALYAIYLARPALVGAVPSDKVHATAEAIVLRAMADLQFELLVAQSRCEGSDHRDTGPDNL